MKLYVGNLPWKIDDRALKELFSSYGQVEDAIVIKNKFNGRSKGFGFVTFSNDEDGQKAMSEMHEKQVEGRPLTVNQARPMDRDVSREERSNEQRQAPVANPEEVNDAVGDSIEDEAAPEVVDDNSDAEEGEEDIDDVEDAMEDAEEDKPAVENAVKAQETTEAQDDLESESSVSEETSEEPLGEEHVEAEELSKELSSTVEAGKTSEVDEHEILGPKEEPGEDLDDNSGSGPEIADSALTESSEEEKSSFDEDKVAGEIEDSESSEEDDLDFYDED